VDGFEVEILLDFGIVWNELDPSATRLERRFFYLMGNRCYESSLVIDIRIDGVRKKSKNSWLGGESPVLIVKFSVVRWRGIDRGCLRWRKDWTMREDLVSRGRPFSKRD
jgi:hypothetical protein